jgi:hypothetical protein
MRNKDTLDNLDEKEDDRKRKQNTARLLKVKVWSKMKLHSMVLCIKDRQTAIFVKAKKDFLT